MVAFNPAYGTSAKLVILRFPEVQFTTQSFVFPSIQSIYPKVTTPLYKVPLPPGAINYEALTLNFLLDSSLKNYQTLVSWIQSVPTTPAANVYSDISVVLLDNDKNPMQTVTFKDTLPVAISAIDYTVVVADPQPLVASATFDYVSYSFGTT